MSAMVESMATIMHLFAYSLPRVDKATDVNTKLVIYIFRQILARIIRVKIINTWVSIGSEQVVVPKQNWVIALVDSLM